MTLNKWLHTIILIVIVVGLVIVTFISITVAVIYPTLPSLAELTDSRPKLPLQVFSEDGYLIGKFGEERSAYVKIEDVPQNVKEAVVAVEDRYFYLHHGFDINSVFRAIITNLYGGAKHGGSTVSMQLARNYYLASESNFKRKIRVALLTLKIENSFSKDKILELYINQIYLGQRAYGFAAAAQVYYGKPIDKLNLSEIALLAGLSRTPSGYNPIKNLRRALKRQKEVLRDMYRFGFIKVNNYESALNQPLHFKTSNQSHELAADYVAEFVRKQLYEQYQSKVYSSGLKVYTTIIKTNQEAANTAVRDGILDYDLRHGYRGPEKMVDIDKLQSNEHQNALDIALAEVDEFNGFVPAIVTKISSNSVHVHTKNSDEIEISGKGLSLVEKTLNDTDSVKRLLKIGAVIRVLNDGEGWRIVQLPQIQSALVAIDPETGAVRAMVGGFDFNYSKFNHVTQAWRQVGSSFIPFIYSAALAKGYTPATIVENTPLSFSKGEANSKELSLEDYDNRLEGPIRLSESLAKPVKTVPVRVLQSIGINYARDYISGFGFAAKDIPANPTMALGAGYSTPLKMATAYAVFANGGYRIKPNLIAKIVDQNGKIISASKFDLSGDAPSRAIDARNAFTMNSMLQSSICKVTAAKAFQLERRYIAGKTGTTIDHLDAWFAGYSSNQVAVTWMGFDKPQTLGENETGAVAALPIWTNYMTATLKDLPEARLPIQKVGPTMDIKAKSDIAKSFWSL